MVSQSFSKAVPSEMVPSKTGRSSVLVIDDEADLRELLAITIIKLGFDVELAGTVDEAKNLLSQQTFDLVLTDMRLPDGDGIALVKLVNEQYPQTPIAVITAFGSAETAVNALKAGAFDYLSKPVSLDQLRILVQAAIGARLEMGKGAASANATSKALNNGPRTTSESGKPVAARMLGNSVALNDVRNSIARLARSLAPVAINGESGSGKELAAREIHAASSRMDKPFVAVNCGAIPEALMEAEFFGYKKGAFTGADTEREGFFQAAHQGTLMLDEVADLPLTMQVKLLRAIQERRVRKIGSSIEEPVDVRIISATHKNLAQLVAQGAFRQDLFYRLNVIELKLPSLRERREDILLLAEQILARLSWQNDAGAAKTLSQEAGLALQNYSFPGNVRELENILERAVAFAEGTQIEVADLGLIEPLLSLQAEQSLDSAVFEEIKTDVAQFDKALMPDFATLGLPNPLPEYLDLLERQAIMVALEQTRYNRTAAARLLGVSFRQLRYRMQRLDIQAPE